jgi:8-oxo-dGTP pyrophosphatase MutT (NUDIX family)
MQRLPVPDDPNPYRVTSSRLLYDSPWIRLREDLFAHRGGAEGRYPVCGFRRTACGALTIDEDDSVALVGQWRHPLQAYSWEIIEGGGLECETPFETIRRELAEEAGLQASVWEPLLYSNLSNSSTDEEAFVFVARGLSPAPGGQRPDDEEELGLVFEPFRNCVQRVFTGEIADGLTIMALLAEQARRQGIGMPMDPSVQERFFLAPAGNPSEGRKMWDVANPLDISMVASLG